MAIERPEFEKLVRPVKVGPADNAMVDPVPVVELPSAVTVPDGGSVSAVVPETVKVVPNAPENVSAPPSVTDFPPMELTAVVSEPAVFVISPVCAGSCAACVAPVSAVAGNDEPFDRLIEDGVPPAPLNRTGAPADPLLMASAAALPVPRPVTPVAIGTVTVHVEPRVHVWLFTVVATLTSAEFGMLVNVLLEPLIDFPVTVWVSVSPITL